jgi:hypothetical protein
VRIALNGACRDCPAYCTAFAAVCALAAEAEEKAGGKSQCCRLKSVVDISRAELLREEFLRLAFLLEDAETDGKFDETRMADLREFTVKVRGKENR